MLVYGEKLIRFDRNKHMKDQAQIQPAAEDTETLAWVACFQAKFVDIINGFAVELRVSHNLN